MKFIKCPKCKNNLDIDGREIKKQRDGLQLIVTCPNCNTGFILQQVAVKSPEQVSIKVKA